jgi:glutaredoxin-like protein NrdH
MSQASIVPRIVMFSQPGCLSCELTRVYLEAREFAFEERDISANAEARRAMIEQYESEETPTVVIVLSTGEQVVVGFDPVRLDQLLDPAPSSSSVAEP